MKLTFSPRLAAWALAAASVVLCPAHAAVVLYEQAPMTTAGALANGTDGQAPLLAETFSFSGVASSLSWWGTAGAGFDVSLTSGAGTGPLFSQPTVSQAAAGFTVSRCRRRSAGRHMDVFRYSIDLGALGAGTYTLAVRETSR